MKYFILFILFQLSLGLVAQSDSLKWSIEFGSGITRSAYRMEWSEGSQFFAEELQSLEKPQYFLRNHLLLARQLTNQASLYSGVQLNNLGYRVDTLLVQEMYDISFRHRIVEIPIGLRYKFGRNTNLFPTISGGIQFGKVVSSNWSYKRFESNETETNSIEGSIDKNLLGAHIQLGLCFKITPRYYFELSGQYEKYYHKKGNYTIQRHYYLLNVNLSLLRYF
jgi:Outer membrane protein beta-barrel domain